MKKNTNENKDNFRIGAVYDLEPDECCWCCGKTKEELLPFGKAGDPLIGDFNGALLVKAYRSLHPYNEKAAKALDEAEKNCLEGQNPREWLIDKYGENGEGLYLEGTACTTYEKLWLCRECIVLDRKEYLEIIDKRLAQGVKFLDKK